MARKSMAWPPPPACPLSARPFLASIVALLLACLQPVSALTLVRDGQARATIIVRPNAADSVRYAAAELQQTVRKMTGALLPIQSLAGPVAPSDRGNGLVIWVGCAPAREKSRLGLNTLGPDGFRIVSKANDLILAGRDDYGLPMEGFRHPFTPKESYNDELKLSAFGETGTLHAVTCFLESFGVRWFMPGDIGEVVPELRTLDIGALDIHREPAFEHRHVYFTNFSDDVEGTRWYKRVGFGTRTVANINHSFHLFQQYRDVHPEYFGLVAGKRDLDRTCQGRGSLCLSDPVVLRQMVQIVRDYFNAHPEAGIFPVMPNDSYQSLCECERCRDAADPSQGKAGKFSDYVWSFVDRVARDVRTSHPDRLVACCSYGHYQSPPGRLATMSSNVAVMLCKQRRNYWDPAYEQAKSRDVRNWAAQVGNVYLWEYYNLHNRADTYYRHLYSWGYSLVGVPALFLEVIKRDLQFLRQNGVKGEFIEVDHPRCPAFAFPSLYITAKLLWDPELDVSALLSDYCSRFYGPGAEAMSRFFLKAEALWMRPEARARIYTQKRSINSLFDDLWQAWALCGGIHRQRVELALEDLALAAQHLGVANPLLREPDGPNLLQREGRPAAAMAAAELTSGLPLPVEPGTKLYIAGGYRTTSTGNLWVRFPGHASRSFLPASPRTWKPPPGDFHSNRHLDGPPWGEFLFESLVPAGTRELSVAWAGSGADASIMWDTPRIIAGTRVVEETGAAVLEACEPLDAASQPRPQLQVTIGQLLGTAPANGKAGATEPCVLSKPLQWHLARHRRFLHAETLPGLPHRLVIELNRLPSMGAEDADGILSFLVEDGLNRRVVSKSTLPVALLSADGWVTVCLATFTPDETQAIHILPAAPDALQVQRLALVPDLTQPDAAEVRRQAELVNSVTFCTRVRTSGVAGVLLRRAPSTLSLTTLPRSNWLRQSHSFGGVVLDFHVPGGRVDRTLVALDAVGDGVRRSKTIPGFPETKVRHASVTQPKGIQGPAQCQRYLLDVAALAPRDWNGVVWVYCVLAGTGDESRYTVVLRHPDGEPLDIPRATNRGGRYATLTANVTRTLGHRLHGGDCYYASIHEAAGALDSD